MDRPARRPAADEHWAPDHIVLDGRVLSFAGRLVVERDAAGEVLLRSPLADMAAVEQRHPAWALGPFGDLEPEHPLPAAPGVYALTVAGVVQYVGSAPDLAKAFGPEGIGQISRRDCQQARNEERCRLNHRIVTEAAAGRVVDLYLLPVEPPGRLARLTGRAGEPAARVAAELERSAGGSWHQTA